MSTWWAKLLEFFPEKGNDIEAEESLYMVFVELLNATIDAHRVKDSSFLEKAYGFAEWCAFQEDQEIWNPAGVCFYEHLFQCEFLLWREILSWLSIRVIEDHLSLWKFMLPIKKFQQLKLLIDQELNSRALHH